MKRFALLFLFVISSVAFATTPVSSVSISPQGAVLQTGSNLQFSVACHYTDGSTDNCARGGGATWRSGAPSIMSLSSSGLATMIGDPGTNNIQGYGGFAIVTVGGVSDKAMVYGQHPGDTLYEYPTPDYHNFTDYNGTLLPMNVVVGSTVAMGVGVVLNDANQGEREAVPFSQSCTFSSSDTSKATIDRHGLITAIAPGSVTLTCGRAGNGNYGKSTAPGWITPGNNLTLNIVNGGTGNTTWYIRQDGGTPFVSASQTPRGQCDGKHDAPYSGTGVNQPCALGNYEYLYFDQVTHIHGQWMISGGDTVIVRQKASGYDAALTTGVSYYAPTNCAEDLDCDLPSIPSGTASQHTRILGENYGSCTSDSAKTRLNLAGREAFSTKTSQFVDIACFEVSDKTACAADGFYTNSDPSCHTAYPYTGQLGIWQSALTSNVNYTDLFIHGLGKGAIYGPSGSATVVATRLHSRGNSTMGINMDDIPWWQGNISVAGGFTMNQSITEFSGCTEEYPVTHNYPYIECRDQSTAPDAPLDGFGTGSTTGNWIFDHDIWRYNFQDGLDLLHSGMQTLSVTNSQSYGNDGQAYKIGPADTVVFQNNYALVNCNRIGQTIGDEPASAIVHGVTLCRAAGDWMPMQFSDMGSYYVQNNTLAGYGATIFDFGCSSGWDACTHANAVFQNNVVLGYKEASYDAGQAPGLFYESSGAALMPPLNGWSVRDHNFYYGVRYCPSSRPGETCNTASPLFTVQPNSPLSSESALDSFNYTPASGSPLLGGGTPISGLVTDLLGNARSSTPSIGAIDLSGGVAAIQPPTTSSATIVLTATPSSTTSGSNVTLSATASSSGSLTPTGTISFVIGGKTIASSALVSGSASFNTSSLAAGTSTVTASYSGDSNFAAASSNATVVTVNAPASTPVSAQQAAFSVAASPNPATPGQAITLSATLSGGSATPTGTVTFSIAGKSVVANVTSGAASTSLSLPAGSYTVAGTYSGDTNFNPASASAGTLAVTAASSRLTSTVNLNATPNPAATAQAITLTAAVPAIKGLTPTGTISFSLNGTTVAAQLNASGVATISVPGISAGGSYTATATYSGDSNYNGNSAAPVTITVAAPVSTVAISVPQPAAGFNVIPGSVRRIFAHVTNGATSQVNWTVKSGSAQLSSASASWVDVTAGSSGSACQISGAGVSSGTQFTVEATSVDDPTKKADVTFNVCKPTVQVSVVPTYRTLYANQPADLQSLVVGSSNDAVQWTITSQPSGGDGKLVDSSARDTVFSASVPGRYILTATSAASGGQSATSILYVTGHNLPYRVTRNQTEPVDCSVDPALLGGTYDVGPSQRYQHLKDVPVNTLPNGSTIRLHNEDATGTNPTVYNEYIQLSQHAAADQPIRVCGVPDDAGNLPILDAVGSAGRSDVTSFAAGNGLVTVGGTTSGAAWPAYNGAQNIIVEGLHLRNAKTGTFYVTPTGTKAVWQTTAACIRVGDGHNVSLIGNELDSCGTGAASQWNGTTWGGSSLNHLWEGNYVHGNGTAGSSANNQMYLQAWGQVVQFNRVDQIAANTAGANLKSRGVQDVIRYNYFGDGSARDLDLVDVGSAAQFMSFADFFGNNANPTSATYSMDQLAAWQEAWNSHFAYGNIYRNSTALAPIHFAYDQSGAEPARKGNLFWYNNTFYESTCSSCSGQLLTLFDTSGGNGSYLPQVEFQTVQAIDNLIWIDSIGQPAFQWNDFDAFIGVGASNLLPAGWGADTLQGGTGDGWNATGNAAAYQNAANLALHITGFTGTNIPTVSSIPFNLTTLLLNSAAPGTLSMPAQTCEMPTRFSYLPLLGYALPRVSVPNMGATDTTGQVSAAINPVGGSGRLPIRAAGCK